MTDRKASITSLTGQDGSHLADPLLHQGYAAHRPIRRASTLRAHCTDHRYTDAHHEDALLFPHCADQADGSRPVTLMERLHPDEVNQPAARLPVRVGLDEPGLIGDMTGPGTARKLEAIRESQASGVGPPRQREGACCCPRSPCGAQKVHSHWMTRNCREASGLFAVSGILSNRESPAAGRRS